LVLGALILLLASGCGKPAQPRGAISGKVTLDGPAVGTNRIEIRAAPRTIGRMIPNPYKKDGSMIEQRVVGVPPRFNSASTLEAEAKLGDNVADV